MEWKDELVAQASLANERGTEQPNTRGSEQANSRTRECDRHRTLSDAMPCSPARGVPHQDDKDDHHDGNDGLVAMMLMLGGVH